MKIKSIFLSVCLTFLPLNLTNYSQAQTLTNQTSDLISPDTKVDYSNLAQLLSAQNWRKANDETRNLILQATGRKSIGWLPPSDLKTISCWDLKTIDTLWNQYSNGRFSFRTQFPIYLETGNRPGKLVSDDAFNRFGDRLGWRKDNDWIIFIENLNYTSTAPIGHLPNPRPEYSITGSRLLYTVLAERMVQCNLVTPKMK